MFSTISERAPCSMQRHLPDMPSDATQAMIEKTCWVVYKIGKKECNSFSSFRVTCELSKGSFFGENGFPAASIST
jgi:hypothetical protein